MKNLLLIALVLALVAMPMVLAAPSITGMVYCEVDSDCATNNCDSNQCVPEFTTIGAGIALIGASVGYALIRKKK